MCDHKKDPCNISINIDLKSAEKPQQSYAELEYVYDEQQLQEDLLEVLMNYVIYQINANE